LASSSTIPKLLPISEGTTLKSELISNWNPIPMMLSLTSMVNNKPRDRRSVATTNPEASVAGAVLCQ